MAGLWYRVGTVTLTNGSKAVVGYGTKWKSANPLPGKGSMLCGPDGKIYEVDTVADDTNMTLVSNYTGTSGAGQGYALVLMALTIPQFSTQLSQFVQKNSLFASQINTLLTATGDVNLTDPDSGLVIKVPSWSKISSEGEGQAARAKVEADKAQTAAATAVNVVREAALPLPDVWAPLSDSLRLITGYGREVKVGSDVIARFVEIERLSRASYFDKSGVFRIAAENEPRFETKGLLIEGRSSNCVQFADKPAQWTFMDLRFAVFSTTPEDGHSRAPTGIYRTTAASNTMRITSSAANQKQLSVGDCLTASARFKLSDQNVNFRFRFANQNGFQGGGLVGLDGSNQGSDATVSLSIKALPDGYVSASATMACKEAGLHYAEFYIIAKAGADIPVGTEVRLQLPQVEPLPSRSSFIPSDSAEAVRESDKPRIPRIGNDNYFGPITLSAEVSCNGPGVTGIVADARRGIFSGYPNQGAYEVLMTDPSNGRLAWAYGTSQFAGGGNQPQLTDGAQHTVVAQMDGITIRAYTDGVRGSGEYAATPVYGPDNGTGKDSLLLGYGAGGTQIRHLWGHLRNVRVWHRALTTVQCQSIR